VELTGHDVNAELAGRPGFKDRAHQLWQEWLSDPTRKVMSSWPQKPQPVKAKLTPGEPLYKPKQSAKGELLPKKQKVEIKQPKQGKGKKQLSQYQEFVQKELLLGGKMKEVAAEWQTQKRHLLRFLMPRLRTTLTLYFSRLLTSQQLLRHLCRLQAH
jgi:hypothetical protein